MGRTGLLDAGRSPSNLPSLATRGGFPYCTVRILFRSYVLYVVRVGPGANASTVRGTDYAGGTAAIQESEPRYNNTNHY